jgi:hypothetical protein
MSNQFLISPRDPKATSRDLSAAVDGILKLVSEARVRALHHDTLTAVLDIPENAVQKVHDAIGTDFIVERNSALRF